MLSSPEVNGVEEEIDNKEMESEEVSLVCDLMSFTQFTQFPG